MVKIKKDKILIEPEDIIPSSKKLEVIGVLNPAAIELEGGQKILYVRVLERLKNFENAKYCFSPRMEGKNNFKLVVDKFSKSQVREGDEFGFEFKDGTKRLTYINHFRRVILNRSGLEIHSIDKKPSFFGIIKDSELGVEDPRIVKINKKYYMTYVGLSRENGISTYLAVSEDCKKWNRLGILFGQQDKDVVLFPEKIKGNYVAFDRPEGNFSFSTPHVWIAYSKDLIHWGRLKSIRLSTKKEKFNRSGAGPPPIKTEKGWLFLFHAVHHVKPTGFWLNIHKHLNNKLQEEHDVYVVYAALLDKENPEKLIARSVHPIIIPSRKYEISLEGKMVVFPTGILEDKKRENILLYSGAGDKVVTVKKISIKNILKSLRKV